MQPINPILRQWQQTADDALDYADEDIPVDRESLARLAEDARRDQQANAFLSQLAAEIARDPAWAEDPRGPLTTEQAAVLVTSYHTLRGEFGHLRDHLCEGS